MNQPEHINVRNLDEFNAYFNQPTSHPMVGIGDLSEAALSLFEPLDFESYCVVLMDVNFGKLNKGGVSLSYRPGTVFTMKPGDVVYMDLDPAVRPKGKILVFRPELIENTGLGRDFYMFNFFDFEVTESLELTPEERKIVLNCFSNIKHELDADSDELTAHMLRLGIGQMLSYCKRFYERQFDTKKLRTSDFIRRLDLMVDGYLAPGSELVRAYGFPTVAWCASQFHLAPNYFGNLVRRDLHMSAQEYLHNKIIDRAKTLLADPSLSVDQVAEQLGFTYANHFSRLFKRCTGQSPTEFRK